MDDSPKILIIADEPMVVVDMLYELESRGFTVEPMIRGGHSRWPVLHGMDAALFDLRQPDDSALQFASRLRKSGVPIVALRSGKSDVYSRFTGIEDCLGRPIDYDLLAAILGRLTNHPAHAAACPKGGALPFSCGILANPPR